MLFPDRTILGNAGIYYSSRDDRTEGLKEKTFKLIPSAVIVLTLDL